MKILVTGGAGFIGSHVVDKYIGKGYSVTIVDNLSTGKKENVNNKADFFEYDIRSQLASELIKQGSFDIINHHASQIDVRKSVSDPAFDADVNIIGLINLMQAAVSAKVKKVIFSSSGGTIYGECGKKPPNEKAAPDPLSPYGISKLSSEYYLRYYSAIHGVKFTILRYGNVFGPRQDPHGEAGVVAIFCKNFILNKPVNIFGNGLQTRDYVFVGDVAEANLKAVSGADNQIINIGTGKAASVKMLYKEMTKAGGFKSNAVYKPARQGELFKSFLDIKKADKLLNWKPKFDFAKGLSHTISYFKGRIKQQ
ncbi:MAG: NAD-dependent epimerase/dehydratase family protein [bacterium]